MLKIHLQIKGYLTSKLYFVNMPFGRFRLNTLRTENNHKDSNENYLRSESPQYDAFYCRSDKLFLRVAQVELELHEIKEWATEPVQVPSNNSITSPFHVKKRSNSYNKELNSHLVNP